MLAEGAQLHDQFHLSADEQPVSKQQAPHLGRCRQLIHDFGVGQWSAPAIEVTAGPEFGRVGPAEASTSCHRRSANALQASLAPNRMECMGYCASGRSSAVSTSCWYAGTRRQLPALRSL